MTGHSFPHFIVRGYAGGDKYLVSRDLIRHGQGNTAFAALAAAHDQGDGFKIGIWDVQSLSVHHILFFQ
jgi:hypothetical protein